MPHSTTQTKKIHNPERQNESGNEPWLEGGDKSAISFGDARHRGNDPIWRGWPAFGGMTTNKQERARMELWKWPRKERTVTFAFFSESNREMNPFKNGGWVESWRWDGIFKACH